MEPMSTAIPQKSASTGTISWQMAALVGAAIAINYLDRQNEARTISPRLSSNFAGIKSGFSYFILCPFPPF